MVYGSPQRRDWHRRRPCSFRCPVRLLRTRGWAAGSFGGEDAAGAGGLSSPRGERKSMRTSVRGGVAVSVRAQAFEVLLQFQAGQASPPRPGEMGWRWRQPGR